MGLDLGQANDYTATSIILQDWNQINKRYEYELQYLARVRGVAYPKIVKDVWGMLRDKKLLLSEPPYLVLDKTGVGAPVCDMFNPKVSRVDEAGKMMLLSTNKSVIEITITSGHTPSRVPGGFHVPKRDLVFALLSVYQSARIKVAQSLTLAKPLTSELTNLKLKINHNGNDSYSAWREAEHDDLVLSLAMAVWFAEYKFGRRHRQIRGTNNKQKGRKRQI